MAQLRRLLETGDIRVQERLRQLNTELRGVLGNDFDGFEHLVSSFDFETALSLLDQINAANA